jgi:hypothetical protein
MAEQNHAVGRLNVTAAMADEEQARRMLARIESFWREKAPPAMTRLFDELAPQGRHVRLERLALDLGQLPETEFEAAALAALERAVREALPAAMAGDDGARSLSGGDAALELTEHYLQRGTVPFWARGAAPDLPARLAALAERQPASLIAALRRVARDRRALERLVLRLGEEDLRRLIALLSPADAALVIAYLAEIVAAHRVQPFLPLSEPALRHAMWVVSLEYLLLEAGTQFNRRSFLAALLGGLAAREDIDYAELLVLLRDALAETERRMTLQTSLPATLKELLAAERLPVGGGGPAEDFTTELARTAPHATATIEAAMDALLSWHRAEGLLPLSDAALRRSLENAARRNLASSNTEAAFFAALLRDLAASEGIPYPDLLNAMAAQSLPGEAGVVVKALAAETRADAERPPRKAAPDELETALRWGNVDRVRLTALIERGATDSPAVLAALLRRLARERATLFRLVAMLAEETLRLLLRVLDEEHADDVIAYLETLRTVHKSEPLLPVGEERFAQITWTLALDYVAREPGSQFNRRSLLRSLIEGFARYDGLDADVVTAALARGLEALAARRVPTGSMPAVLAELIAENARTDDTLIETLRHAANILRGDADGDAWILARLAEREPVALAALLREVAQEDPSAWPARLERLRRRLTQEQISLLLAREAAQRRDAQSAWDGNVLRQAAFFLRTGRPKGLGYRLPGLALREPEDFAALLREIAKEDASAWAGRLERLLLWLTPQEAAALLAPARTADAERAAQASSWLATLTALARGEALPEGAAPRRSPEDDIAIVSHWLEHGALPGWAPADLQTDHLARMLETMPRASLRNLFFAADHGERLALLQRATDLLGESRGRALLMRLIPWSLDRAGALGAALQAQSGELRHRMLLRAAAEGVAGLPLDLESLSQPFPEQATRMRAFHSPVPKVELDSVALLDWLKGAREATRDDSEDLAARFAELADRDDAALRDAVLAAWRDPALRRRWIAALPDRALARLLYIVAPFQARFLLEVSEMLDTAWRQITQQGQRARPWAAIFDLLAEGMERDPRKLSQDLVTVLAGRDAAERTKLLTRAYELAREGGEVQLTAVLQPPPPRATPAVPVRETGGRNGAEAPGEPLYVRNAGLVLFAPYLPGLFERLHVLQTGPDGKPRIAGVDAASRAVHLLQYLVDERCDMPEPELVLNKLLCGLDLALPIAPAIEATEAEREICDGLIQAVIANWPIIKNTSPAGLRETFLQREGKIARTAGDWQLRVQRKTVDVLVDQIPWSFSVILHPWMEHPIHVTW